MTRFALFIFLVLLAACTQHTEIEQTSSVPPPPSLVTAQSTEQPGLAAFYNLCLSGGSSATDMLARAKSSGYQNTTDGKLAELKQSSLRKTTLVIPGGGAFISETQEIMHSPDTKDPFLLVVEQQFANKRHIKTECNIFARQHEYLATCTALGYMLERAPSHNARYERKNAHFVEWSGQAAGKPLKINCSGDDGSDQSNFVGTRLSAKYLHVTHEPTIGAKLKKLASRKEL